MKKKTYELLLALAVIVCAVIGIRAHTGNFGGRFKGQSGEQKYVNTQTFDTASGIEADVTAMDVSIVQGDSFSCTYRCGRESEIPEMKVENGILKITQKNHADGFFWLGGGPSSLEITVPEDMKTDRITVSGQAGDLYMEKVTAEKTSVSLDAGDFSADQCSLGDAECDFSAGDCALSECTVGSCRIDSSAGDVTMDLKGGSSDYSFDVSTSAGDVEIDGDLYESEYQYQGGGSLIFADLSAGDISIGFSE